MNQIYSTLFPSIFFPIHPPPLSGKFIFLTCMNNRSHHFWPCNFHLWNATHCIVGLLAESIVHAMDINSCAETLHSEFRQSMLSITVGIDWLWTEAKMSVPNLTMMCCLKCNTWHLIDLFTLIMHVKHCSVYITVNTFFSLVSFSSLFISTFITVLMCFCRRRSTAHYDDLIGLLW